MRQSELCGNVQSAAEMAAPDQAFGSIEQQIETTAVVIKSGYLLESPVEVRYSSLGCSTAEQGGSENPRRTDNQQERLEACSK